MTVLATMTDVKANMPINTGFGGMDIQLTQQIAAVSAQIRTFCRRQFDFGQYTAYGSGIGLVQLKETPVLTGSVTIDYDCTGSFASPYSLVLDTDFYIDNLNSGIVRLVPGRFRHGSRFFRIGYQGGYAPLGDEPNVLDLSNEQDIVLAIGIQVGFNMTRIRMAAMGEQQQEKARNSLQQYTQAASSGLIGEAQALLVQYRKPLVGAY